jgi:hypothetical protein
MGEARVEGEVEAPLADVWKLVSDFVGFPAARGLDVTGDGQGVGMTRTIRREGSEVIERLEALDDEAKRLSYSIVKASMPVRDYLSTIELSAISDDKTGVVWSCTFEATAGNENDLEGVFGGVYATGLKGLAQLFASS